MADRDIMRGFPPPADRQVTIDNWREPPFNRWAFRNLRQIVPTAPVGRGAGPPWALERAPRELGRVAFEDVDGNECSVGRLLEETYTDGFIVVDRGRIVAEWYENGMTPASQHILMSVTKSVTGSLAGILVDRGVVDADAPVADYVSEAAGSAYGDATVRHLLDMTVGVRFVEDYEDEQGDFARYRMATGWATRADPEAPDHLRGFLTTLPKEGRHGETFHYVSPNTDVLGWVLERATGTPFAELLEREIWSRLGAEFGAYIALDRLGAPRAAGGLCVTLRDLARFGRMHLEHGLARGEPVVPAWWIRDMREGGDREAWLKGDFVEWFPDARYRSQWYALGNPHDAFCGLGIHGQAVYVDPVAEAVIVKLSSQPKAVDVAMGENELRAFHAIGQALVAAP